MVKLDHVGVRLPDRNLDQIDELVAVREFDSGSSSIRYAVKEMLMLYDEDTGIMSGSDGPRIRGRPQPDIGQSE